MNADRRLDPRAVIPAVLRGLVLILLGILVMLALSRILLPSPAPTYRTSATISFFDLQERSALENVRPSFDIESEIGQQLAILRSKEADTAVAQVIPGATYGTYEPARNGEQVDVVVTGATPRDLADVANAYAEQSVALREAAGSQLLIDQAVALESNLAEVEARFAAVEEQLAPAEAQATRLAGRAQQDGLTPAERRAAAEELVGVRNDRDQLIAAQKNLSEEIVDRNEKITALRAEASYALASAQVTRPAQVPTTPYNPGADRNRLFALALGALLGSLAAYIWYRLDSKLRSTADVAAMTTSPIVGTIPRPLAVPIVDQLTDRVGPLSSVRREALRSLAARLRHSQSAAGAKIIGVTSPTNNERASALALDLARSLAMSGLNVLVVSARFMPPASKSSSLPSASVGFGTILTGASSLDGPNLPGSEVESVGAGQLIRMGAGDTGDEHVGLLSSDRAGEALAGLSAGVDYIVVDCAPVLTNAETLGLSRHLDSLIVFAQAGRTAGHDLSEAIDSLAQVGAPLYGTVFHGPKGEAEARSATGTDIVDVDDSRVEAARTPPRPPATPRTRPPVADASVDVRDHAQGVERTRRRRPPRTLAAAERSWDD